MTDGRAADAAMADLVMEVLSAYFTLRKAGMGSGLVSERGQGLWGFLRMLKHEGPMTVPQVARRRGVSRQYILGMANKLSRAGLVTFEPNPQHRRSQLLALTPAGDIELQDLERRFKRLAASIADGFDAAELAKAAEIVSAVRDRIEDDLA